MKSWIIYGLNVEEIDFVIVALVCVPTEDGVGTS